MSPPQQPVRREIVTEARLIRVVITPKSPVRPIRLHVIPHRRVIQITPQHTILPAAAGGRRSSGAVAKSVAHPVTGLALRFAPKPAWASAIHGTEVAANAGLGASSSQGSGSGSGAGPDAANGEEPCGFVTFSDPHGSRFDPQTRGFWVDVKMSVHFADGSMQSLLLDYPWYYTSEAVNPWSDQNLRDPNFPTRFQPPPSDKLAGEPPVVRYVIAHSTPEGMTLLRDCPVAAPAPQP